MTFEAGVPYVLTLRNVGQEKHYFTAHEFYRIATRKAETAQSEVKVPYFTAIEVYPGQEVELYFIPVLPGSFELFCEIEGTPTPGWSARLR